MRYAFVVINKSNRKQFAYKIERDFEGGYVGFMLQDAQQSARKLGGKLLKSDGGFLVECEERRGERLLDKWQNSSVAHDVISL